MSSRQSLITVGFAACFSISAPAWAEKGCPDETIAGLGDTNRGHCIEHTDFLPPVGQSTIHNNTHPQCGNYQVLQDEMGRNMKGWSQSGQLVGAAVGSYFGGAAAGILAGVAGGELAKAINKWMVDNGSSGYASCKSVCLPLPENMKQGSAEAYGWISHIPKDGQRVSCDRNSNCAASFSSVYDFVHVATPGHGSVMCMIFSNWPDTDKREVGLRVYYDTK